MAPFLLFLVFVASHGSSLLPTPLPSSPHAHCPVHDFHLTVPPSPIGKELSSWVFSIRNSTALAVYWILKGNATMQLSVSGVTMGGATQELFIDPDVPVPGSIGLVHLGTETSVFYDTLFVRITNLLFDRGVAADLRLLLATHRNCDEIMSEDVFQKPLELPTNHDDSFRLFLGTTKMDKAEVVCGPVGIGFQVYVQDSLGRRLGSVDSVCRGLGGWSQAVGLSSWGSILFDEDLEYSFVIRNEFAPILRIEGLRVYYKVVTTPPQLKFQYHQFMQHLESGKSYMIGITIPVARYALWVFADSNVTSLSLVNRTKESASVVVVPSSSSDGGAQISHFEVLKTYRIESGHSKDICRLPASPPFTMSFNMTNFRDQVVSVDGQVVLTALDYFLLPVPEQPFIVDEGDVQIFEIVPYAVEMWLYLNSTHPVTVMVHTRNPGVRSALFERVNVFDLTGENILLDEYGDDSYVVISRNDSRLAPTRNGGSAKVVLWMNLRIDLRDSSFRIEVIVVSCICLPLVALVLMGDICCSYRELCCSWNKKWERKRKEAEMGRLLLNEL